MTPVADEHRSDPFRAAVAVAPAGRDGVVVDGPDAGAYLQGQLSQDVGALDAGSSAWSLLLEPTGKVTAWLRVTRTGDETFLLDVDAGAGEAVVARLQRFKLRTRCTIEPAAGPVVALRGPASATLDIAAGRRLPIVWPGVEGFDLLDERPGELDGVARVDAAALEALRIEAGVPRTGSELTDRTIPAEAGQWLVDASVSFTKGCYTGQELVARIDSRGGNVPRRLFAVVVDGDGEPRPGASLLVAGGDQAVGTLTSVAWSPWREAFVGLAFVGRAVAPPADATVVWEGGRADARILATPLAP
jgi:folate-binding protein YgfZ